MSNVVTLLDPVERRWEAYREAIERANKTLSIEDGIAAGKAWRQWLDLFMTSEQRNSLDASRGVIGSPERRA